MQTKMPGIFGIQTFGPGVTAAFSGRSYDESSAPEYLKQLGLSADSFFKPKQVHGDEILVVRSGAKVSPETEADGIITREKNITLGIKTADCIPAFYWDPVQKAAGLAHAGWRGLHKGILGKMIRLFKTEFGSEPKHMKVVLGPFVGPCCYETGPEFASYFPGFFHPKLNGKGMTDLGGAALQQLVNEGINVKNSRMEGICTACRSDEFYSARKGAVTERILSVISIN